MSEWHLFIYRGLSSQYRADPSKFTDKEYLLESLKTCKLANWSNVSLCMFSAEWHEQHPKALYNNEQFAFVDKFQRVYSKCDFYLIRPYIHSMEGTIVRFGLRWSLGIRPDRKILPPLMIRCTPRKLEHFLTTHIESFKNDSDGSPPGDLQGSIAQASSDV